jgi:PBP1b-binding outer membrane lipoprotein LpoB
MKKITMALVGGLLFVLCHQLSARQNEYLKKQEITLPPGAPTSHSAAKFPEEMRNSLLFRFVNT